MSNNNNNSDRDKILEEILSMVDNGRKKNEPSRAERAAASSANRAASGKRTEKKEMTASRKRTDSMAKTSSVKVQRRTSADTGRTSPVRTAERVSERTSGINATGTVKNINDTSDRTVAYNTASVNKTNFTESRSFAVNEESRIRPARSVKTENPEEKPERKRKVQKKRRKMSGRLPLVLILTTIIFTVAIALSVLIISVGRDMLAIGKSEDVKIVTIPEGCNTEDVAQILYDEGIIKIPKAFVFISKLGGSDKNYIAGEHELSPSNAYETIIDELTTDKSLERETVDITFLEGCDLISAGKQLEEAGVCDAERFVYYFNAGDYGFEFEKYLPASSASKFNRMEGYLFPDTYTFYVDTDPEIVCQKIYKNFDEKFRPEFYTQMKKMNMTLDEVVTLASIVQAESPDVQTMKKVASVFENRLANPEEFPKLQSDPTSYYVDEVIKPNIEIKSEAIFDAYDTYKCNGLPPGAIGNPGLDAIEAVLYPAKTDYYFFYANIDTMETYFAKTNEEHEANKEMVREQQTGGENDDENGEE